MKLKMEKEKNIHTHRHLVRSSNYRTYIKPARVVQTTHEATTKNVYVP